MSDTPDNFANHPKTLTEHAASTSHDATKWTPRDALINALRDLDAGNTTMDGVVIAYHYTNEEGGNRTGFYQAAKNRLMTLGALYEVCTSLVKL